MRRTEVFCPCGKQMYELSESHRDHQGHDIVLQCQNPDCSGELLTSGDVVSLDLFCGVGGVCRGLKRYGHSDRVIGVELDGSKKEQYTGYFIEHDLTEGMPEILESFEFDIAWASPPCQFATGLQFQRSGENLIPVARKILENIPALMTVIENVPDAREHLNDPVQFCGSAFGMDVQKHRLFETNFDARDMECDHPGKFKFCIGDREAPVTEYRKAHGLRKSESVRTKQVRECIPVQYVDELWHQYQGANNGIYSGNLEENYPGERLIG